MQNYCKTIGALAAASALVAGNASAEVEYELHTGYSSEYLFRGFNLGDDLVEAGVDVSSEWNGLGLSAGAWYGSYDALGVNTNELDLYGEVSKDLGFATVAVGYIWYINDNYDFTAIGGPRAKTQDFQEAYLSVARDFGFAAASLTYYWDVEGDNNGYTELALSRSFELSPCLALNVGTSVGYLVEEGDFSSWTTKVALDWGFAERAKLSPFLAYSMGLSDTSNDLGAGVYDNEFIGGSMLSVSF